MRVWESTFVRRRMRLSSRERERLNFNPKYSNFGFQTYKLVKTQSSLGLILSGFEGKEKGKML
jgi:hypothetical protein